MSLAASQSTLRAYDFYWRDKFLGQTLVDTSQFEGKANYVNQEIDQASGIFHQTQTGFPAEITATFVDTTVEFLQEKLLDGQVEGAINGLKRAIFGGNRFRDMRALSGRVLMHPSGVDLSDDSNDITLHLAAPMLESLMLRGSRTKYQDVPAKFSSFPDFNQPLGQEYWRLGSNIQNATPLAIVLSTMDTLPSPYIGVNALSVGPSAQSRANAFAIMGTPNVVADALVNGAIGAAITTLVFDNGASPNPFTVGMVVQIATERILITAVSYATPTTGTLTIVRGVGTQNGAGLAIADNASIFIIPDFAVLFCRDNATYLSSVPANILVGDTYATGASFANRKGVITHGGAAGASNVTGTFLSVTSGALVATSL